MKKKYITPTIRVYVMASLRPLLQTSDRFDGTKKRQDIYILDDDITSEKDIG